MYINIHKNKIDCLIHIQSIAKYGFVNQQSHFKSAFISETNCKKIKFSILNDSQIIGFYVRKFTFVVGGTEFKLNFN